ncbi:MAG: hypothetical protein HOY75_13260 [Streptomyces sp.]|nr:hypothetical protein [Streptomyces sp.]
MATDEERRAQHRHKHKQRVIRGASDDLWDDLDTATKKASTDRSAVTRQFWEWYVGRPDSRLPVRPADSEEPT